MNIRHTVGYHYNFFALQFIHTREQLYCFITHHNNLTCHFANLFQYSLFVVGRFFQYSMERNDKRNG